MGADAGHAPFDHGNRRRHVTDSIIFQPPAAYAFPQTTPSPLLPGTACLAEPGGISESGLDPGLLDAGLLESGDWTWELLPAGLIYRPYLAGGREPRFAGEFVHLQHKGWFVDATLGGRVGLLRYGSGDTLRPEGWQLDFEGAAFPRLTLDEGRELVATDYRYGVP